MFRVLIVDDQTALRLILVRFLEPHFEVVEAGSGEEGLQALDRGPPFAVVVADYGMEGMNGIDFLAAVEERSPQTVRVMLTGNQQRSLAMDAINQGHIFRFLLKPPEWKDFSKSVQDAAEQYRLVTAEKGLLEQTLSGAMRVLTDLLAIASPDSSGRAQSMREKIGKLAAHLRIRDTWELETAALLARIGEITLPPDLLTKARVGYPLTLGEGQAVLRVPEYGAKLLAHIPRLENVAKIVLYQAKHFDGTGFPGELIKGEEIPLGARMLCIIWDLTNPASEALSVAACFKGMARNPGRYDPALLEAARDCFSQRSPGPAAKVALKLSELTDGHRLAESIVTVRDLLIVGAGTQITPALLQRLRNFADVTGVREPIVVEG